MQHRGPLEEFPADAFERLLQTNIASVFHVGQAVARHMIGRGAGKIVNICSVQTALARPRYRALHRDKRRCRESHQRHGDGLGEIRAAMQRPRAGVFRDAAQSGAGGGSRVQRVAGQTHPLRAVGARWRNWSAPRFSCHRAHPPSSMAPPSLWTGGASRRRYEPAVCCHGGERLRQKHGRAGSGGRIGGVFTDGGTRCTRRPI